MIAIIIRLLRSRATQLSLVAIAMVAAGWFVFTNLSEIEEVIDTVSVFFVLVAVPFAGLHLFTSFLAWKIARGSEGFLKNLSNDAALFFAAQLGKYIPGGVGNFALMLSIDNLGAKSMKHSVPALAFVTVLSASTGLIVGGGIGMFHGLPVHLAATSLILGVALTALMFAWSRLKRFNFLSPLVSFLEEMVVPRLVGIIFLVLLGWVFVGFHIVFLFMATGLTFSLPLYGLTLGLYAFGWSVGTLTVAAPAGIGVRETAFIMFSAGLFFASEIFMVALMSRILFLALDVGVGVWGLAKINKFRPRRLSAVK